MSIDDFGDVVFKLIFDINALPEYFSDVKAALIDIPIGLHTQHPEQSVCDKQARAVLSSLRHESVFPAPSRCAFSCQTYEKANFRNRESTGRGLSRHRFVIMQKNREVEPMLRAGQHEYVIHGMHPEVCFWALNGNKPMAYSKRTDEGFIERMAISRQYFASSQQVIDDAKRDHRRTDLARDDIVDALVGTVCARNYPALSQFPNHTEIDDEGLPMEIMYRQP